MKKYFKITAIIEVDTADFEERADCVEDFELEEHAVRTLANRIQKSKDWPAIDINEVTL